MVRHGAGPSHPPVWRAASLPAPDPLLRGCIRAPCTVFGMGQAWPEAGAHYGNLLWSIRWQNTGEIAKMARSPNFMAQWPRNPGGDGHEFWQSA